MADKSSQLVLNALTRATADAAGVPLHGSKTLPGLFPATTVGKQAAQRCREEGFLRSLAAESSPEAPRGKGNHGPVCTITDKGIAYLLSQVSPRQVLEDFVRVLEAREEQVMQLMTYTRQIQANLEALRTSVAPVLAEIVRSPFPACPPANGNLNELFHEFRQEPRKKNRSIRPRICSLISTAGQSPAPRRIVRSPISSARRWPPTRKCRSAHSTICSAACKMPGRSIFTPGPARFTTSPSHLMPCSSAMRSLTTRADD